MKGLRKTSFEEDESPAPKKNRESRFLKQLEKRTLSKEDYKSSYENNKIPGLVYESNKIESKL